ncbi:16S rRNA (cytosine(967)-C(5))-methyltransferase RsmB [Kroppenstedtia eburnea]|uniref:16S rRNA (cytosine(967)-C(5))-methyltransferase n=1 Tax=Kroppenstedtia eburnea TaxID=714067 RepID=A0A1N7J2H7_9BACL|nr:16S rRNA (cytosine(967)-C(5))-methyltransferase RsmB [Kroppenstedtia eburnea]QKI83756.1 16S rRNA (cytosine(967)-C(5))-methyltransferase RsmB [Kroppenstedtia eburnea]SIS43446.1 16S rRNA (cytosine967-C5)-methyltransferase [Kroppenstedtia eburnea]
MTRPDSARNVALDVLIAVEERGAYSNLLLNDRLKRSSLSPRDRGLATELVYGTLQRKNTLDWILNKLVRKGIDTLDPWVRHLLRLGIYQLRYLDRVPSRAAVHETVEIAKARGHRGIPGLVNGVLRSYLRRSREWTLPDSPKSVTDLALVTSHPEWLVRRLVEVYGPETAHSVLKANNRPPGLSVRVNPLRGNRERVARLLQEEDPRLRIRLSPLSGQGLILTGGNPASGRLFREGWFTVQDESSMLVAELLAPRPGERVLDGCAAPGGKTGHLAERMENRGTLLACDIHPHKVKLIENQVRRLGLSMVEVRQADLRELPGTGEARFDRVLLDAPCSGWGVIRRKPDIKWSKNLQEVDSLRQLQAELLEAAARLVTPGGTLVYSTCTLEPQENREQITAFLKNHPTFQADSTLFDTLPAPVREKALTGDGWVQILPHHFESDGFFIARMIKEK